MVGFALLGSGSSQTAVMVPLMLLGLGWSLFQSPNLSGMFNAVEPRYIGSVSGLSLTSANIANAMGVAVGSVLFMRWLNFYGLASGSVAAIHAVGRQCRDLRQGVSGLVDGDRRLGGDRDRHVSHARSGPAGEMRSNGKIQYDRERY